MQKHDAESNRENSIKNSISILESSEPGPYEIVNALGASEIMLVCDHASNRVPNRLNNLGLSPEQLTSHIGWDSGAALVARKLSALLDAPLILSNYSRLVIDCNRAPDWADSIPTSSAGIAIPGNQSISEEDVNARRNELFEPYQAAISKMLDSRSARKTILLNIHSFTPSLQGAARPWSIGVCYQQEVELAQRWVTAFRKHSDEPIGDNEPYRVETNFDYTIPVQAESRNIPGIMLEIRKDKIANETTAASWGELIAKVCLES